MSADGQRTKWRRNIAENFNRLSRVHERYRQTTDRRQTDGRRHIANVNVSSRSLKNLWINFREIFRMVLERETTEQTLATLLLLVGCQHYNADW